MPVDVDVRLLHMLSSSELAVSCVFPKGGSSQRVKITTVGRGTSNPGCGIPAITWALHTAVMHTVRGASTGVIRHLVTVSWTWVHLQLLTVQEGEGDCVRKMWGNPGERIGVHCQPISSLVEQPCLVSVVSGPTCSVFGCAQLRHCSQEDV
jgi:hypothetical protein